MFLICQAYGFSDLFFGVGNPHFSLESASTSFALIFMEKRLQWWFSQIEKAVV
jgi:hypothetical protein